MRAESQTPRRAGVSSFGFGGTNFHFILEEEDGKIEAHQSREQPDMKKSFGQLWTRIKGLPARTE